MNVGDYVTAREHLDQLVKTNGKADYIWYGFAVLDCLTGHVEDSLEDSFGRSDSAESGQPFPGAQRHRLQHMADDPRFTELLYPEPGASDVTSSESHGDF